MMTFPQRQITIPMNVAHPVVSVGSDASVLRNEDMVNSNPKLGLFRHPLIRDSV